MLAEVSSQASSAPRPLVGGRSSKGVCNASQPFPASPVACSWDELPRQWELRGCLLGHLGETCPSERERSKGNILSLFPSDIYRHGAQSRGSCPWQYAEDGGKMEAVFLTANPQTSDLATCVVEGQTINSLWATHSLYCYSSCLFFSISSWFCSCC